MVKRPVIYVGSNNHHCSPDSFLRVSGQYAYAARIAGAPISFLDIIEPRGCRIPYTKHKYLQDLCQITAFRDKLLIIIPRTKYF